MFNIKVLCLFLVFAFSLRAQGNMKTSIDYTKKKPHTIAGVKISSITLGAVLLSSYIAVLQKGQTSVEYSTNNSLVTSSSNNN